MKPTLLLTLASVVSALPAEPATNELEKRAPCDLYAHWDSNELVAGPYGTMVRYRVDARAGVHGSGWHWAGSTRLMLTRWCTLFMEKARRPEYARGYINPSCEVVGDNHAVNYITVRMGEPALNDYRQFNQDVVNQWRQESVDSGGGCDVDSGF